MKVNDKTIITLNIPYPIDLIPEYAVQSVELMLPGIFHRGYANDASYYDYIKNSHILPEHTPRYCDDRGAANLLKDAYYEHMYHAVITAYQRLYLISGFNVSLLLGRCLTDRYIWDAAVVKRDRMCLLQLEPKMGLRGLEGM